MDKAAKQLAAEVLELASDTFSNNTCNEFEIEDTLLNRSFVISMNIWAGRNPEDAAPYVSNGKICVADWMVMSYCAHLLKEES